MEEGSVYFWRWHITKDIVFPPYGPNEKPEESVIIRFKWWKKLLMYGLIIFFIYGLYNRWFFTCFCLLVLPVRIHNFFFVVKPNNRRHQKKKDNTH